jgi:hypothetical protein
MMREHDHEMVEDRPSAWTRPWFLVSAAFVAVLLAVGVTLAVTGKGTNAEAGPAATTAATVAPSVSSAAAGGDSACGLPAGDQTIPAVAPKTTWALIGRVAAPSNVAAGPGVNDNGFRSCFAHSPVGAVLAAANVLALSQSADFARRASQDLVAPGRGRDLLLARQSAATDAQLRADFDARGVLQFAGFRVEDYTPDEAVIGALLRNSSGVLVTSPVVMQWSDGDWKWLQSPTGGVEVQAAPDMTGYIPWAGV